MNTSSTIESPRIIALPPTAEPTIVCPAWCVVPKQDHINDLFGHEGFVIHWSADHDEVRHSAISYPDGTPDPSESPLIFVDCHASDGISPTDAEQLAQRILQAVKEARS